MKINSLSDPLFVLNTSGHYKNRGQKPTEVVGKTELFNTISFPMDYKAYHPSFSSGQ